MNYELAKKLKDAGFPQKIRTQKNSEGGKFYCFGTHKECYIPTLSELIEACGDDFGGLIKMVEWSAASIAKKNIIRTANTPEIAVANLWLALK